MYFVACIDTMETEYNTLNFNGFPKSIQPIHDALCANIYIYIYNTQTHKNDLLKGGTFYLRCLLILFKNLNKNILSSSTWTSKRLSVRNFQHLHNILI